MIQVKPFLISSVIAGMLWLASGQAADMPPAPQGPYWSIEDQKAGLMPSHQESMPTAGSQYLENNHWQWGAPNVQPILESSSDHPGDNDRGTTSDVQSIWGLPEPLPPVSSVDTETKSGKASGAP